MTVQDYEKNENSQEEDYFWNWKVTGSLAAFESLPDAFPKQIGIWSSWIPIHQPVWYTLKTINLLNPFVSYWDKAIWLDDPSHMTIFNQSKWSMVYQHFAKICFNIGLAKIYLIKDN